MNWAKTWVPTEQDLLEEHDWQLDEPDPPLTCEDLGCPCHIRDREGSPTLLEQSSLRATPKVTSPDRDPTSDRLIGSPEACTGDACELQLIPFDAPYLAIQYRLPAAPAVPSEGALYKLPKSCVKTHRVPQPVVVPTPMTTTSSSPETKPCYECKASIVIALMVDKGKWWPIDPIPDQRDGWVLLNWNEERNYLEGHTLTGAARKEYRSLPPGDQAPLHRPHFQTCQGEKAKARRAEWEAAHPRKGFR